MSRSPLIANKKDFITWWARKLLGLSNGYKAIIGGAFGIGTAFLTHAFVPASIMAFVNPISSWSTGAALILVGISYLLIDNYFKKSGESTKVALARVLTQDLRSKEFYKKHKIMGPLLALTVGLTAVASIPAILITALSAIAMYTVLIEIPTVLAALVAGGSMVVDGMLAAGDWLVEKCASLCGSKASNNNAHNVASANDNGHKRSEEIIAANSQSSVNITLEAQQTTTVQSPVTHGRSNSKKTTPRTPVLNASTAARYANPRSRGRIPSPI